jgi:hypothetical protein
MISIAGASSLSARDRNQRLIPVKERTAMRAAIPILLLLFAAPFTNAQQPSKAAHAEAAAATSVSAEDAQALREDIQRMKSLVDQMDRNLANVSFTQDALKHQFQLEIEMWRLQIAHMERRLGSEPAPK